MMIIIDNLQRTLWTQTPRSSREHQQVPDEYSTAHNDLSRRRCFTAYIIGMRQPAVTSAPLKTPGCVVRSMFKCAARREQCATVGQVHLIDVDDEEHAEYQSVQFSHLTRRV